MESEWHTLHRIEELSNFISFVREYETNTITRNGMRCNNHDNLLKLSFILKIPTSSEVFLSSRTNINATRLFCENRQWVLTQGVIQENNFGGR